MSYEPTTWKAGDTVTSTKLNKLEQGVASSGNGALIVEVDPTTMTLGEKAIDIFNALNNGKTIYLHSIQTGKIGTFETYGSFYAAALADAGYIFIFNLGEGTCNFYADTDNDYPEYRLPSQQ